MQEICIPEDALKDEDSFKDWSIKTCMNLFPDSKLTARLLPLREPSEIKEYFDAILKYVTFVFKEDRSKVYDRKFNLNPQSNKLNCLTVDLVSIACVVVMSHWKVGCSLMGRAIGKHHSTIIYYRKRHHNYLMMKDYKIKYLRLLNALYDKGIIYTIKASEPNAQRILRAALFE